MITPCAPSSAPASSLERQEPVPLIRSGHRERLGLLRREAEARIVRRVADQQDRAMAEPAALRRSHGASAPSRCRRSSATDRRPAARAAARHGRPRPAVTSHSLTVPTTRPSAARATKARPSDGLRPRRSFSDDLRLRPGPMARSSSASRAGMSAAVSAVMAKASAVSLPLEGRVDPRSGSGLGRSRLRTPAATPSGCFAAISPSRGEMLQAAPAMLQEVHLRNPSQAEICSTSEPVAGVKAGGRAIRRALGEPVRSRRIGAARSR